MKRNFLTLILLLASAGFAVSAQDENTSKGIRFYDDYRQAPAYQTSGQAGGKPAPKRRGRPGAMITLELKRAGKVRYAALSETFYSGDLLRLHVRVNRDAYLTILNQGSQGNLQLLYPKTLTEAEHAVTKTLDFTVPATAGKWLQFDDVPGVERMVVILSSQPSRQVLQALASGNNTPTSTAQVATQAPPPQLEAPAIASSQDQEVADMLNSKSFKQGIDETSKDFTEVGDEPNAEGNPATFVISTSSNSDLRKPLVYRLSLKHAKRTAKAKPLKKSAEV